MVSLKLDIGMGAAVKIYTWPMATVGGTGTTYLHYCNVKYVVAVINNSKGAKTKGP